MAASRSAKLIPLAFLAAINVAVKDITVKRTMNCLKAAFQVGTSQQQRQFLPADALKMQQRRPNQFIVLMHRIQQTHSCDAAIKRLHYI